MPQIDRLDLRKKAPPEPSRAQQQVPVRVAKQSLQQEDVREEDDWQTPRQEREESGPGEVLSLRAPKHNLRPRETRVEDDWQESRREREEAGPGEIIQPRISRHNLRLKEANEEDVWEEPKRAKEESEPREIVHPRISRQSLPLEEPGQEDVWEKPKQSARAEGVPKEIAPTSFINKVEKRFAAIEDGAPGEIVKKKNKDKVSSQPHQAVAIHSSLPPEPEPEEQRQPVEEQEPVKRSRTVNLRERAEHKKKKSIIRRVEEADFEEKVAAQTNRETFAPVEENEPAEPEVFEQPVSSAYERSLLSNGLKFVMAPISGTKTVTALMMYGTGSKYESLSMSGLSHFLEHMFFKGTKKRPNAQRISGDLDSLGCEYNAFTTKEYTGYWIKIDSSKIVAALEILSDMLLHSEFATKEINKERGVIIEEVNMYHENPMMYIEDIFESCLYGDLPAGREIIGTKANINGFKQQNFLNYFAAQYGANSAVLCLAGDIKPQTKQLAEKYFGKMGKSAFKEKIRTPDAQRAPAVKIHYKEGNQAVMSLGVRAYDTYHQDKIALKLLSIILGGSTSSRLFTEVREKRGLAYSVHTTAECYTDSGYLTTQAGVPVDKEEQAIKVILAEYKKLRTKLVDKDELKRAKDLIKGRTIIAFEGSDNVANWYAQKAVLKEALSTPEEYLARIDKITAEDILRVAKDIFKNEKLNLAIIGPFQQETDFEAILKM